MTSERSMKLFGVTQDDIDLVMEAQEGKCPVCKREPLNQALGMDHDHKTGVFRGLLCPRCNRWLVGNLSVEEARAVYEYLRYPPAVMVLGNVIGPKGPLYPKRKKRRRRNRRG